MIRSLLLFATARIRQHLRKSVTYEEESKLIRERAQSQEARREHKFHPAEWTFKNGHPRCRICGEEERTGGVCVPGDAILKARIRQDVRTDGETVSTLVLKTHIGLEELPEPDEAYAMVKGISGGGHPIDYKTEFQGLPITIENRAGSIRRWRDRTGKTGATTMQYPYGYLRLSQGMDGDHVDCFLGPERHASHAYIVHQMAPPDFLSYDEDKAMLGFASDLDALNAYFAHYTDMRFCGSMTAMPMAEFTVKLTATKDRPRILKALWSALWGPLFRKGNIVGTRWITVHPHGAGSEGQHVMIRESKGSPGTWHVVGGAAGKLNYLRLTGVKSDADYQAQSREKAKAKREADKAQALADKEAGTYESKTTATNRLRDARQRQERGLIDRVGQLMGWQEYDLRPDQLSHLSDTGQKLAASRHHRRLLREAMAVVQQTRDRLLMDAEMRTAAGLGDMPLFQRAQAVIGLTDLRPDPLEERGLGFAPEYGRKAEEHGLTDEELESEVADIQARQQADLPPGAGAMTERMGAAMARARAEVQMAETNGTLRTADRRTQPVPISQVTALLAEAKQLKAAQADARKKTAQIRSGQIEPVGKAMVLEATPVGAGEILAELERDAADRERQDLSVSFLNEVERDPTEVLTATEQAKTLRRHLAVGGATALTKACQVLTGQDVLPRDTVDVMGIAGAARALAYAMHRDLAPAEVARMATALETFHSEHHQEAAKEALRQAQDFRDQAAEIALGPADHPSDLALAQELNEHRLDLLREARAVLGTTLGEMEATAALEVALKSPPVQQIQVSLGPISPATAVQQARALGLAAHDYQIDSDGTNRYLTVRDSGIGALTQRIDPADTAHMQKTADILAGRYDEDGWLPHGFVRRPLTTFTDPTEQALAFAKSYASTGDHVADLQDYIGSRMADGEPIASIYSSLLSDAVLQAVPDDQQDAYFAALDTVAPLRNEQGQAVLAESHAAAFEAMAERFVRERYGPDAAPLHAQRITMDSPDSFEALHRALAKDPRRMVAFRNVGDLTRGDQDLLRDTFERRFANPEEATATQEDMASLGPEPAKESDGLFGVQENPAWREWHGQRQAILERARETGLTWDKYVALHRGRARAYAAVQDVLKSDLVKDFADVYGRLTKTPLKIGRTVLSGNLAHLDAVDPDAREARLEQERQLVDALRNRIEGKYATGSVKDKLARTREMAAIADQNQRSMFFAETGPNPAQGPAKDERYTLGRTVENQLAAMLPQVARNFDPKRPVKLAPDMGMDGRFINKQRAIKMLEHTKRVVLAQGTGSGKTSISLGAFTHLHKQGKVEHGIFAVPSIVQDQFGAEAANMMEPGKYQWFAQPGADFDTRLAAYKNQSNHFAVVTHQALRDDLVKIMAAHHGWSEDEAGAKFMAAPPASRRAVLRSALEKAGIAWQYLNVDEAHDALNRKGKPDSLLAGVLDALSADTLYYVSASADPIKNDVSELHDQLKKMDPARYADRGAFLAKYGVNTDAAQEALRREMRRYIYPGRIDPGVQAHKQDVTVPLSPEQRGAYAGMMDAYQRARRARAAGTVDVAAVQALSPSSFERQAGRTQEAIARHLQNNLGILRDTALERVLNLTEAGTNAKTQTVLSRMDAYKKAGKPVLIFAHHLEAVAHLERALTQAGHRVATLTGKDSGTHKARKKAAFQGLEGQAPTADVMILSDAGAVGANLQRGQAVIHYDLPHTAKTWYQRTGRIHRLGQTHDVDVVTLQTDTYLDRKKKARIERKSGLRHLLTSPYEGLDDTGLAAVYNGLSRGA